MQNPGEVGRGTPEGVERLDVTQVRLDHASLSLQIEGEFKHPLAVPLLREFLHHLDIWKDRLRVVLDHLPSGVVTAEGVGHPLQLLVLQNLESLLRVADVGDG